MWIRFGAGDGAAAGGPAGGGEALQQLDAEFIFPAGGLAGLLWMRQLSFVHDTLVRGHQGLLLCSVCSCGNRDTYGNPNTDKIISFRGSRRALTEVTGRVTLEEAASCDPGTRRKDTLTAG